MASTMNEAIIAATNSTTNNDNNNNSDNDNNDDDALFHSCMSATAFFSSSEIIISNHDASNNNKEQDDTEEGDEQRKNNNTSDDDSLNYCLDNNNKQHDCQEVGRGNATLENNNEALGEVRGETMPVNLLALEEEEEEEEKVELLLEKGADRQTDQRNAKNIDSYTTNDKTDATTTNSTPPNRPHPQPPPQTTSNTNTINHSRSQTPPSSSASSSSSYHHISPSHTTNRPIVRSVTFNRDRTCLILSTSVGVRIRALESLEVALMGSHLDNANGNGNDKHDCHNTMNNNNNNNTMHNNDNSNIDVDDIINNNHHHSWIHDVSLLPDGATYAQLFQNKNTFLLSVIRPSTPRCLYLYNAKQQQQQQQRQQNQQQYNAASRSTPLAALPLSAAIKRVEMQRKVMVALTVDGRLHIFHMLEEEEEEEGGKVVQTKLGLGLEEEATTASPSSAPPSSSSSSVRPKWIQTLQIMHPTDSLRNISRGMDIFYAGSYFDLSPNDDEPYLVCKSFNGTAGTIRVYDPTIAHEVDSGGTSAPYWDCNAKNHNNGVGVGGGGGGGSHASVAGSAGGKSTNSGGGLSVASSTWDYNANLASTGKKKPKRRIHLHTTINAHEHQVTRMLIGGGGGGASTSTSARGGGVSRSSFLATASSKGTTIRVFGLPHGEHLWEWHRGSRACQFHSLSWNGTADRLVTYGSSGTIHVFDWQKKNESSPFIYESNPGTTAITGNVEKDFLEVDNSVTISDRDAQRSESQIKKPLMNRIGSKIRRKAVQNINSNNPVKHRSFAKLKFRPKLYHPTTTTTSSPSKDSNNNNLQNSTLVVALLDRVNGGNEYGVANSSEDSTLVMCSLYGELCQYSVKSDGSFRLNQTEDVLFRDASMLTGGGRR